MAVSVAFLTEYWSCNRWHCVSACKTISFFPGSKRSVHAFHQHTRFCHLLHNPYPMQNDHIDLSINRLSNGPDKKERTKTQ